MVSSLSSQSRLVQVQFGPEPYPSPSASVHPGLCASHTPALQAHVPQAGVPNSIVQSAAVAHSGAPPPAPPVPLPEPPVPLPALRVRPVSSVPPEQPAAIRRMGMERSITHEKECLFLPNLLTRKWNAR